MASLHELHGPILQDMLDGLREPLGSLQGNILSGHGRERSVHIFLKFKEDRQPEVKQWISDLAEADRITSAQRQLEEAKRYRQYGHSGRLFMNLFLSAAGYQYLDPGFRQRQPGFNDKAFLYGMKAAQHRLNDPPQSTWDSGYRQALHAMLLLADHDEDVLRREEEILRETIAAHTEIAAVEWGKVMRLPDPSNPNRRGLSVEHFGYVDSLGQPRFFASQLGESSLETSQAAHAPGPDVALVRDPYGRECDSGSYLVFRKLEQHVYDYAQGIQKLAQTLAAPVSPTHKDIKRAEALVMGRFKDGTPVVRHYNASQPVPVPNDFDYENDPQGQKCPFQAHIRKLNPRQKGIPLIVRRGVPYGKRVQEPRHNPSLSQLPNQDVGLLFMCYQRNIEEQFEFLQCLWANDPRLPDRQKPGVDPVSGQPGGMGAGEHMWPVLWGNPRLQRRACDLHGFVTFRGGEYLFAPSIYFLKHLQTLLA
jgi:Dyp-type peroxidase family